MEINAEKFDINQEMREITFSCASDLPCIRYDQKKKIEYEEILVINENSVDLSRLNNGASLLFNHDANQLLGMVEKAWIANERVFVRVRFSANSEFAERIWKDILDGIIKGISIGYQIESYQDTKENGVYKRYVDRFLIYQTSVVSIPFDDKVGIRNYQIKNTRELENMETEEKVENEVENVEKDEVEQQQAEEVAEEAIEKTSDEENVQKDEVEQLKEEIAKLKQELANKGCGQELEQKSCDEQQKTLDEESKQQMQKIAEDFNVPKQEVSKAIDKKLTVKEFKNIVKNFNITHKETKKMNRFADYLKDRQFQKPFVMRDFTGFADADLVGTETTPLVAALDKRLGVKGYRAINGLHNNLSIPVQSSRIQVATKDMCAPATDSNPAFTAVTLEPQKITGSVNVCKEMLVNTNSDVEAFIIDSLLKEISYKVEQLMLGAVAASAATEINYSAITAITWGDILAMQAAIDTYLVDNTAFVMSPAARAALKAIPKATDAITGFICEDNEINGYRCNVSGVAVNDNIYFGDWNELVLASWGEGIEILVDPYTESRAGNVIIVASALVDAAVVQPDAFAIGKVQESSSSEQSSESSN